METAIVEHGDNLIGPVMDLSMARDRLQQFQQFVKEYLVENEDFGTIPGTPKPTLLKPGADKLCELYGLADDYAVVQRVEDWDKALFDYEVKCTITSKRTGTLISTGMGSCNSYEKRYRWRDAQRKCPNCGKECIIKGKDEYGGGWLCFAKKGGCGAKFTDGDPGIVNQAVGKVQNEDVADLKNTILKMAKKRAKIDATLSATRSSGVFTQDIEDWDLPKHPAQVSQPEPPPPAQPQAQPVNPRDSASSPEKPSAPKPPKADPPIKPQMFENVLLCEVKEVFERKTRDSKATSYLLIELRVPFEGHARLFNFHGTLFDALKTASGQICRFVVAPGAKGTMSIEDVKSIGEVPYKEGNPEEAAAGVTMMPEDLGSAKSGIKMFAAKGTNLIGVGWFDGTMRCAFAGKDGATFGRFAGVPEEAALKLIRSPYPDKLFSQIIKGKYQYEREAA